MSDTVEIQMVQQGRKKGKRLVVNQCMKILVLGLLLTACSTSRTTIYNIANTGNSNNEPVVFVEFEDEDGAEIVFSAVKVNDKDIYLTEEKNTVKFTLQEGKYSFEGLAINYLVEKTNMIKIRKGDSLSLPMVMKMDTIPLVD